MFEFFWLEGHWWVIGFQLTCKRRNELSHGPWASNLDGSNAMTTSLHIMWKAAQTERTQKASHMRISIAYCISNICSLVTRDPDICRQLPRQLSPTCSDNFNDFVATWSHPSNLSSVMYLWNILPDKQRPILQTRGKNMQTLDTA